MGTRIDLVVRGSCCLIPGLADVSENINVKSIIGRYLEHSRIYRFGSAARGHTYLVGSADLMPRNLDGRVEALIPIAAPHHVKRLDAMLDLYLADDQQAWELNSDGSWSKVKGRKGVSAQLEFEAGAASSSIPTHRRTG